MTGIDNNHIVMVHEDPMIVDYPASSKQPHNEEEAKAAASKPVDNIMSKWRKAMKQAYEAQLLLQQVMDALACAMHKHKAKDINFKYGHHHCHSHHESSGREINNNCHSSGTSSSSTTNSSSSASENEIGDVYCNGRPCHMNHRHHHHLGHGHRHHHHGSEHSYLNGHEHRRSHRHSGVHSPHHSRSHSRRLSAVRHNDERHHHQYHDHHQHYPIIDGYC